ncbi:alpha/beta hydrolase [Microbacterium rhizomatis]|uniref:Alpha/beta hydrolase n=1 Tax=Microbacterium rhizomatis TaxID=1631477 RepID=A0A5J5J3T1_9MICO|nr:alpha/beta fold hydrolase [Microbacterium rhizomatis]KAA9110652.1 alpha/beta hydrolase [Microbacterium rhizomatis]
MSRYRSVDVPVDGGALRVGVWEPRHDAPDAPAVLLIHGVTASHLSWALVADRLPDLRLIAPDLRGRGRSNALPVSAGLSSHARDLTAVLDALDVDHALVVGHSMGAFAGLVLGEEHPERVTRLVLVDGGLPLDLPAGLAPQDVVRLVLGPTAERLAMRFASVDAYLDFWRAHPAFARDWSPALEAYLAYDLVGDRPDLRPATTLATVEADSLDQNTGNAIADALAGLRHPTLLMTAERGLLDQVPALYAADRLPGLVAAYPGLRHVPVADVNHYTIVLSDRGADAVASAVREELGASAV